MRAGGPGGSTGGRADHAEEKKHMFSQIPNLFFYRIRIPYGKQIYADLRIFATVRFVILILL